MIKLNWQDSVDFCLNLKITGQTDWRVPTRVELESLLDISRLNPASPEVHPFLKIQSAWYWSSINRIGSGHACLVSFVCGLVFLGISKEIALHVWPVRGGNFDHSGILVDSGIQEINPRFTDNQDGTVTDCRTGLVWIKDLNLLST